MFGSIRWRIVVAYVILILLTTVGLTLYLSNVVRESYLEDLRSKLAAEARLIEDALSTDSSWEETTGELDRRAKYYADLLDARVTLIGADGAVLGESQADRTEMDNHFYRPEIQEALEEGLGHSMRLSRTTGQEMMYVAVPVTGQGEVVGFVRVALPLEQVASRLSRVRWAIGSAAAVATGGAAIIAFLIAEYMVRPIRQLTDVVKSMARGNLDARILPTTRDEIGTLSRAFNQMSERLRNTITKLAGERSRLSAVLDNMADGVLITDDDGFVRLINPAAADLLRTDREGALGRSFAQVARDHRIIELWKRCRADDEELVDSVELDRQGPFVQVIVSPLERADRQSCLVILQDLTRVRRLQTVRRDFISNISHELRTPLASLRALTETLRDGALEDPPAARRFLDRMETEVDALAQMVSELLELSRIESGQVPFRLSPRSVSDLVYPPVERLQQQAERADLEITLDLSPGLPPVLADAERVHQVITNLVHNAIKFTPPGGKISILSRRLQVSRDGNMQSSLEIDPDKVSPGEWVVIVVEDTGVGIPASDLPRIFERFYKADRARSGGGTGLGLAIAKHIILAHGGHIWAESVEGHGAQFYVALPTLTLS